MTDTSDERELTAGEIVDQLGEQATLWPGQGIVCTRGPDWPDKVVKVHKDGAYLGHTHPSHDHDGLILYLAHLTDGHPGVPYPAGFIPPDPVYAQRVERLRWLPRDHPDYLTALNESTETETT